MFKNFFYFFLFFFFYINLKASDRDGTIFLDQLSSWKIDYANLSSNKAGAACLPLQSENKYKALGLSYQLADIEYAKKIAIDGCNKMKEKNEILSSCECEIIFVNDKYIGDK